METLKRVLFGVLLVSGLVFASCSADSDDDDVPRNTESSLLPSYDYSSIGLVNGGGQSDIFKGRKFYRNGQKNRQVVFFDDGTMIHGVDVYKYYFERGDTTPNYIYLRTHIYELTSFDSAYSIAMKYMKPTFEEDDFNDLLQDIVDTFSQLSKYSVEQTNDGYTFTEVLDKGSDREPETIVLKNNPDND